MRGVTKLCGLELNKKRALSSALAIFGVNWTDRSAMQVAADHLA